MAPTLFRVGAIFSLLKSNTMLSKISRWFFGLDISQKQREVIKEIPLEKGKTEIIFVPDFGYSEEYKITKWCVKPGHLVKSGDIVCELENGPITFEYESYYCGQIQSICQANQNLKVGDELFKIQGI